MSARQHSPQGPFTQTLHLHDFPQVWYCQKGTYRHTVDGREYLCLPGSVLTVPPGTTHGFQADAGVQLLYFECSFYLLKALPPASFTAVTAHLFCRAFEDQLRFTPVPIRQ